MAINELGIFPNSQGSTIGTSLRVESADGTVAPYLRFKTQSDSWTKADIAITVDVITKSGTETLNGYSNKGSVSMKDVPNSSFSAYAGSSNATGWIWSLAFSSITGLSALLGTLSYSGRSYDAIRLKISVKLYFSGGSTSGTKTCYIGFIPTFTASEIYIDKSGLTVAYTATGWNRPNDRWAVMDIADGSEIVLQDSDAYGKIGSAGKLTIPKAKLKYIPANGDTLTGSIRMTGSWMGTGTNLGYLDLSTVTVINKYATKTPTLSLLVVSDGVRATVGQTGTGSNLDSVEVSLVGSDYVLDKEVIPLNGQHVFKAVPVNVPLTFQAVGYSSAAGELAASATITKSVDTGGDPVIYESEAFSVIYDSGSVELAYNIQVDTSNAPEAVTVKFAGRKRQTVGFGEGGSQTWRISADIITEAHDGLIVTTEQEVRSLPERGVCILRFPDGERAQVYITTVNVSRSERGGVIRSVDIDAEEVA